MKYVRNPAGDVLMSVPAAERTRFGGNIRGEPMQRLRKLKEKKLNQKSQASSRKRVTRSGRGGWGDVEGGTNGSTTESEPDLSSDTEDDAAGASAYCMLRVPGVLARLPSHI
jgi:hypothetical protein